MPLLYNTPKLHQLNLHKCLKYEEHLPPLVAAQVETGKNFCWLLAPAIASSASVGEIYLNVSETHPQRCWDALDRMTVLFNSLTGLSDNDKENLVTQGASWQADGPKDKLQIKTLYTDFGMMTMKVGDVYTPGQTDNSNVAQVDQVLSVAGPILLCRPSGVSFHMEVVVGAAKLRNKDDDKIYGCFIVVSTQPRDGSEEGKLEARPFSDMDTFAKRDQLVFYRFKTQPKKIIKLTDTWRTFFIMKEVLPSLASEFKSQKGFEEVA